MGQRDCDNVSIVLPGASRRAWGTRQDRSGAARRGTMESNGGNNLREMLMKTGPIVDSCS